MESATVRLLIHAKSIGMTEVRGLEQSSVTRRIKCHKQKIVVRSIRSVNDEIAGVVTILSHCNLDA